MKIKKGDLVKVLVGKDKGRTGIVQRVLMKKQMVVVDGVNIYKKHQKADAYGQKSGIVEVIKPVDVSNVMLVCPSCKKTTRVGLMIEGGKKYRVCKKCGAKIENPSELNVKTEVDKGKETKKKRKSKTDNLDKQKNK